MCLNKNTKFQINTAYLNLIDRPLKLNFQFQYQIIFLVPHFWTHIFFMYLVQPPHIFQCKVTRWWLIEAKEVMKIILNSRRAIFARGNVYTQRWISSLCFDCTRYRVRNSHDGSFKKSKEARREANRGKNNIQACRLDNLAVGRVTFSFIVFLITWGIK